MLLPLVACREPHARPPAESAAAETSAAAARPKRPTLPAGYALTDTGAFEGMTNGGRRGILRAPGGAAVDTVELGFGVHQVGADSLVLLTVRTSDLGDHMGPDYGEYVLLHAGQRVPLRELAPHFDDGFSSPALLDGGRALYYWGFVSDSTPAGAGARLLAMRYDFPTARLDSLPLDAPPSTGGTDDRGYYQAPFRDGDAVVFEMPAGRWSWTPPNVRATAPAAPAAPAAAAPTRSRS